MSVKCQKYLDLKILFKILLSGFKICVMIFIKRREAVVSSGLRSARSKSGEAPRGPDSFCTVGELRPRREQAQRDNIEARI